MPRGRKPKGQEPRDLIVRGASSTASFMTNDSDRSTRSNSASGLDKATTAAASRPRRSLRSSFMTADEPTVTPAISERASTYSTPATSAVPTPDPSVSPNGLHKPVFPKLGPSFEIHLPQSHVSDDDDEELSAKAMRNSIYSMKPKRKRAEVQDSEDEEELYSDNSPDAVLARRLQTDEYKKAAAPISPQPLTLRGVPRRQASNATPSSSRAAAPSLIARFNKKIKDSEEESDDFEDEDDSDDEEPIRTTRGRRYVAASRANSMQKAPARGLATAANRAKKQKVVNDSEASATGSDADDHSDSPMITSRGKSSKAGAVSRATRQTKTAKLARRASSNQQQIAAEENVEEAEEEDSELESLKSAFNESDLSDLSEVDSIASTNVDSVADEDEGRLAVRRLARQRRGYRLNQNNRRRLMTERSRLEKNHPELETMWTDLKNRPVLKAGKALQPASISRQLKPFQLEGLAWMMEMEKTDWKGGLLGDEMGLGKTIQAVSLIMSDFPAKKPSLVLVPPVALMQWVSEIASYTDGTLKTFVFHGTNAKSKTITSKELKKYDVIMMSYNSLESMYRKQEKGWRKGDNMVKEESLIHAINFHRVILDEAHSIKTRSTMTAKACFALNTTYRWCLTGTPLQNRIGEFFSLIRFLNIRPFASYLCKQCPCSQLEWSMNEESKCKHCNHSSIQHVSIFNQELLTPIQKFGNFGKGAEAFRKLRLMTDRIMLRRLKKDHTNSMELPVKEVNVDRQFFGEEENDFATSIMTSGQRKFDTYVAQGVLLNNYANIFGLIMQMRQVADHPDLLLKKNAEGGQNVLVCCICDEPAEDTIRSRCKHDFCRTCAKSYLRASAEPDCPSCHIPLNIDLEQPEIEQDQSLMKKSSIINRINMEKWTSSSKIELLVHEIHRMRSDNTSHKSIIFSQFTTMLQLIEWRLRRAGITTVMLDGTMTPPQRQASIDHFMNNVDVECFLVSLKAGGVALNLTEASRVFIVDPWWNPAAEWQSADRCHRIGQTRPCVITRLCIEDSVESRMVLIQEKKTNMINSTVNADDKAMESLSPEDMQFLFRGT